MRLDLFGSLPPKRGEGINPYAMQVGWRSKNMKRQLGIFLIVLVLYGVLVGSFNTARSIDNHIDLAKRLGFYGVLTLGAGTLIITGGIDLSIGSLVGLAAFVCGMLLEWQWPPVAAA